MIVHYTPRDPNLLTHTAHVHMCTMKILFHEITIPFHFILFRRIVRPESDTALSDGLFSIHITSTVGSLR